MTWPAPVNTSNADAGADNPQVWRLDALDLMQKFNQLRSHVSVFVQTLLASADAPAVRAALDVPTRAGSNATGTWNISVSGSAASAGVAGSCTGNAATVTTVTPAQVSGAIAGMSAGGVGTYIFAARTSDAVFGSLVAGSSLFPTSAIYAQEIAAGAQTQFDTGASPAGTWMCMGRQDASALLTNQQLIFGATLYMRVA